MSDQDSKFWSNAQTYGMAVICMILGIAAGYLLHAPAVASPTPSTPSVSDLSAPASPAAPQMPSASDMKRMADKQVAPMLADLEKHPNDADLLAKIARAYMAGQQFQSAQQYYEKSIAAKPKVDALNELAFVYVKLGDLDRGIATLNRALAIDPKNPQVAARLLAALKSWRVLEPNRRALAEASLRRVAAAASLSRDVSDIVQRALAAT